MGRHLWILDAGSHLLPLAQAMHDLVHCLFRLDDNPHPVKYFHLSSPIIFAAFLVGNLDQEPSRGVQILDLLDGLHGYNSLFLLSCSDKRRLLGPDDVPKVPIAQVGADGEAAAK